MSRFITRLLDRHLHPGNNVSPQLRGRFEPETSFQVFQTSPLSVEESPLNSESSKSHFSGNGKSIKNEVPSKDQSPSFQQKIPLSKTCEPEPISTNKPQNKSESSEFSETIIDKSIIDKLPSKSIAKSEDGNRERENQSPHKPKYQVKDEMFSEQIQSSDKVKNPDLTIAKELLNKEHHGIVRKAIRKETSVPVVKPANLEPGFSPSIKSSGKPEDSATLDQGILRIPKWLGEWKTIVNQSNEIKVTQTQSTPTIRVNIGRIEVKAVMQQAQTPNQKIETPAPKLSLDDYLNQRNHDRK